LRPRVLAVVAAIPGGRVTTYGAIARHLGATARQVAHVLATFTAEESAELPWFRVVAANGVVSAPG
jgi:methylated-DNA-protein-cysteine methyltransferase-like protein